MDCFVASLLAMTEKIVIPRACGGSSTPRPLESITDVSGILDRPPSRAMTVGVWLARRKHTPAFSRRTRPEVLHLVSPQQIRGRGECRMPDAPAASRVEKNTRVSHHRLTGITRHSLRNGFNGFLRALPGDRALLPPSPREVLLPENLTPASGRQDHTTSPSASDAIRQRRIRVHRIPSRVSDDRERPSGGRDGGVMRVIWVR
jgi:hypothetical protein